MFFAFIWFLRLMIIYFKKFNNIKLQFVFPLEEIIYTDS